MRRVNNIPEIRAELLLNYLYPEMGNHWIAQNEGTFYRNYSSDLFAVDDENKVVETARDSFLKLLPQGLFTQETDLKGKDAAEKYKQMKQRLNLLHEAFKPIDTFKFRESVYIEHQVANLLQNKISYILKTYFGINLGEIESPYVRETAILLPFVSKYRGDLGFIANLLQVLLRCEVKMTIGRYSHTDTTQKWLPMVRYNLIIPELTTEEYHKKDAEIEPLRDFLREWFVPFEVCCQILIKEYRVPQQTDTRLTLGYNTEIEM